MTQSIEVSGHDLSDTLKRIVQEGGRIESMDVIGVARYRVNYFQPELENETEQPNQP